MFKKALSWVLFLCSASVISANNPILIQDTIRWEANPVSLTIEGTPRLTPDFENAIWTPRFPNLPVWTKQFPVPSFGDLNVTLTQAQYEPFDPTFQFSPQQPVTQEVQLESRIEIARRQTFGVVTMMPIRQNPLTGNFEKLVSFTLSVTVRPRNLPPASNTAARNANSTLADGAIYKIAVNQNGIFKLDYAFLKNQLGISNLDNIDPRTLKILSNGGGMLPEANATFRYNDPQEIAIFIAGENDGKFDPTDYVLFYAQSPNEWTYQPSLGVFLMNMNFYDTRNHYFIKISNGNGKRIAEQTSATNPTYTTSTFDDYQQHEVELVNLLDLGTYTHGSGKVWYGENFKFDRVQNFDFSFPNTDPTQPAQITTYFAARCVGSNATLRFNANGTSLGVMSFSSIGSSVDDLYAQRDRKTFTLNNPTDNLSIQLDFSSNPQGMEGWLNYLSVQVRRNLSFTGSQLAFRDKMTFGNAVSQFNLSNATANVVIWDVSNPLDVKRQQTNLSGSQLSFAISTNDTTIHQFVAFDGSEFFTPEAVGQVPNQNLHALPTPDMVIIYDQKFQTAVDEFADFRRTHEHLTVETVEIQQIYNEFSGGSEDATAIRDFMKHLYDKASNLQYLLLFGDASFDFRNIKNEPDHHHYVPTFETIESLDPIYAFPTDDYYGLLDNNEGINPHKSGALDIGIGRFPVRSELEADQVVHKIINYQTNSDNFGDWKNRITFISDDEDSNAHLRDADAIAKMVAANHPVYNLSKIYIDAFPQQVVAAGERYPAAEATINANMFKGHLVMSYLGHGDSKGITQERILDIQSVNSWNNPKRLPLIITATCSFAPYDDATETSIGELMFLKPNSGAIALYTTVRAVYAGLNKALTQSVFETIFQHQQGSAIPPLGNILSQAKNACVSCGENSRKFTLIGDPSLRLAYAMNQVVTTQINHHDPNITDTLKALEEVTIEGEIQDLNGNLMTNFNGTVYPTIFDKVRSVTALGNDPTSRPPRTFDLQDNILFRGRATVTNGRFSFKFIVPKDIDYTYGYGKISYYAEDGNTLEAQGYWDNIVVGGASNTATLDDAPPVVQVFINDENFAFGGITDENPILFVKLSDDLGINTAITGVGHEITAILNQNNQQTYVLNDFFEADLNDYRSGKATYPLQEIPEGRHSVEVKAWDVSNNSATGYTEFVVASNAEIALRNVLNYPNPFTTRTTFQFEHNLPNQPIRVMVQIFTVSGKLVKTINQEMIAEGYRITDIEWDGTDDFGNSIGRGVYVYKVAIASLSEANEILQATSAFEKLVILK